MVAPVTVPCRVTSQVLQHSRLCLPAFSSQSGDNVIWDLHYGHRKLDALLCKQRLHFHGYSTALSGVAAIAHHRPTSLLSWILGLNWIQLSPICCCRQSGKIVDLLPRHCLPHGQPEPWAASGGCAVVQISLSMRQSGKRQASLKAA